MNDDDKQTNNDKNIEFAYALMCRKLDIQNSSHSSIEAKIGVLVGFVGDYACQRSNYA